MVIGSAKRELGFGRSGGRFEAQDHGANMVGAATDLEQLKTANGTQAAGACSSV